LKDRKNEKLNWNNEEFENERILESQIRKQKSQTGQSNLGFLFSDLRFKDSSDFEFSIFRFRS